MEDKKIIKQDINFLEFPNWVIDRRSALTTWSIEKIHGKYEVISPLGLPKHFDKIVIYFLLYKLYHSKNLDACSLVTSRYEIAKNIFGGNSFGGNIYARILKALKKWKAVSINFEGVFYEDDGHTVRYFSIIDEVVLRQKSGEISIRFSDAYIKQLNESKFYKLIDFEQIKLLHRSSSARLYEILVKNFSSRTEWAINIQLLAEKITFEKREFADKYYPSDILRSLRPSINEINKKTELFIEFHYNKDTGTCVFKKLSKPKDTFVPATKEKISKKKRINADKQISECLQHFNGLSEYERQNIIDAIKRDPFLGVLSNEDTRIFAYMTNHKLWQPTQ